MENRSALGRLGLDKFSGLYLWALFIVVFGILRPHIFLTVSTLHSVASTQAVSGIVALAVLIPLACGNFDLSVGGTANLSGILAVVFQDNTHWPPLVALVVSVAIGLLIGAVNGLIVVRFGVNSFIATLGMGSILAALQVIVTGSGQPVQPTSTVWNDISQRSVGGFQLVVLYLLVLAAIVWWIMDYTPFGRHLYAVGGNANAARLSGVRTGRLSWISLIMSAGLASLAGVFFTSQSGPSLSFGATLLLPAFAAAFLGSTQLFPGRFNVWGTILSIYVLATGVEGLQLISGQQWLSNMFDGVALIVAVGLAVWQTSSSSTRRKKVKPSSLAGADGSLPIDQGEREPAVLSPPDGG